MFGSFIKRRARRSIEAVNEHDYDTLLGLCHDNVTHRFGGQHALGGVRHGRAGVRLWFERLGRVLPSLKLTVTDIWITGGPWKTMIFVRWTSTGTPLDGRPYDNHGVHIVETRWGKVSAIDANEDSEAVADMLRRQAASGIAEAAAPPIET